MCVSPRRADAASEPPPPKLLRVGRSGLTIEKWVKVREESGEVR